MSSNHIDRRLVALLREIAELSQEASLTGSLEGGSKQAANRYNALLRTFVNQGHVPEGLFEPLEPDADYSRIGVEARLLAAFLEQNGGNGNGNGSGGKTAGFDASFLVRLAPFVGKHDLSELVGEYMRGGSRIDQGVIAALAPFLDKESLGHLLKFHLKFGLKDEQADEGQPGPTPAPAPRPSSDPTAGFLLAVKPETTPHEHYLGASLEELASMLKDPDLSTEMRQEIAIRLAEIAHEQANKG